MSKYRFYYLLELVNLWVSVLQINLTISLKENTFFWIENRKISYSVGRYGLLPLTLPITINNSGKPQKKDNHKF